MNKNYFFQEAVLLSRFSQDLSQIYRRAIFDDFHHGRRSSCIRKNESDLQLISNHPVFQFETEFFSNSFCAYKANIKKELRFLSSFLDCDFTKYRHKTFATNELSNEMKEILWQVAEDKEIVIEKMEGMPDHVHVLISFPPSEVPPSAIKALKDRSAFIFLRRHPEIRRSQSWGGHL